MIDKISGTVNREYILSYKESTIRFRKMVNRLGRLHDNINKVTMSISDEPMSKIKSQNSIESKIVEAIALEKQISDLSALSEEMKNRITAALEDIDILSAEIIRRIYLDGVSATNASSEFYCSRRHLYRIINIGFDQLDAPRFSISSLYTVKDNRSIISFDIDKLHSKKQN